MSCCKDPSTLDKGRSVLIRVGKKKTTNKHRERGKKKKKERKREKDKVRFQQQPCSFKAYQCMLCSGSPSQSSLGWEGLCH